MKANYHTHTTWCDGRDTPEGIDCAFDRFGREEDFVLLAEHLTERKHHAV